MDSSETRLFLFVPAVNYFKLGWNLKRRTLNVLNNISCYFLASIFLGFTLTVHRVEEERSTDGEFRLKSSRAAASWVSCGGLMALQEDLLDSYNSQRVRWPEPGPEPAAPSEWEGDNAACTYRNVSSLWCLQWGKVHCPVSHNGDTVHMEFSHSSWKPIMSMCTLFPLVLSRPLSRLPN